MYYQIVIQSLAIVALLIWTTSYHFNNRKTILLVQLVSFLFWISHFILIGAYTGAVLCSIGALRLAVFSFKKKENWNSKQFWLYFFIGLLLLFTILTISTYWAIFAFLGGAIAVIASWQNDKNRLRALFIPTHICWFIYDFFVGSYGGAISEMVLGISALTSLLKFSYLKRNNLKTKKLK